MKFLIPVFLFCLAINSVFGFPARDPKDDAEFVSVPKGQQGVTASNEDDGTDFKDFKGVVDTGYSYPLFPPSLYNPFSFNSGFFDNFEDVFRRIRERMFNNWWTNVPKPGDADWDPSEGNSTSEVKIIDGHKVVVNDTVYTKKDDSGNAIFRVRILNIQPVDSSEETGTAGPSAINTESYDNVHDDQGSPEVAEKQPKENEISGNIDSTESTTITINNLHGTNSQYKTSSNLNKDDLEIVDENEKSDELLEIKATNGEKYENKNGRIKYSIMKNEEKISSDASAEINSKSIENKKIENMNGNNEELNSNEKKKITKNETKSKDIDGSDSTNNESKEISNEEFEILNENEENERAKKEEKENHKKVDSKDSEKYQEFDIDSGIINESHGGIVSYDDNNNNNDEKRKHKLHTSSYTIIPLKSSSSEKKGSTEIDSSEENYDKNANNKDKNNNRVGGVTYYNPEWDDAFNNNYEDEHNNDIDIYESIPIDLSNDIAVNQMLADQGAPTNPDAEIFSIEEFNNKPSSSSAYGVSSSASIAAPSTAEGFDRIAHQIQQQQQQRYVKSGYLSQLTDYRPIKK